MLKLFSIFISRLPVSWIKGCYCLLLPFPPPISLPPLSAVVWVVVIRGSLRAVKWSLTGQDCLTDLGKACSEGKYHRKELPKTNGVLPQLSSGLDIREGTPEHSYNFPLHYILLFFIWILSPRWKPIACYFYTPQGNIMVVHNLRSGDVGLVVVVVMFLEISKISECCISVAFPSPDYPELCWQQQAGMLLKQALLGAIVSFFFFGTVEGHQGLSSGLSLWRWADVKAGQEGHMRQAMHCGGIWGTASWHDRKTYSDNNCLPWHLNIGENSFSSSYPK